MKLEFWGIFRFGGYQDNRQIEVKVCTEHFFMYWYKILVWEHVVSNIQRLTILCKLFAFLYILFFHETL